MRKFLRTTSVVLVTSLALFAGCKKGPSDGVVATVNGKPILQTDMDKIYDAQLASNPQQQNPSADQAESLKLNILHELIVEEIVEQRAAKLNLTATDAEVDAKLAEMKAPYTEEQFQARLKASNRTLDDVKHDLRRSLTIDKLLNKEINSKITVTDGEVSTYYAAHKAEYNLLENQYHLAQIQVTAQGAAQSGNLQNSKASSEDEARRKIQAIKTRIDAGEDFGSLAVNFSERPDTAPNGGDMGFVPESQMKGDPATYNAIMKLKAGETTEILTMLDAKSMKPAGYAIYKLIAKESAGQRELGDPRVQQAIRQQLHDSRSQLLKSAYFEMLRDQSKVQNFYAEQVFKDTAK
ncbi:SurA N-terminal domain-containing protein [Granulicella cerasi]|uniref:peptidylprolyl isomerase n=1 Tax=Granulicella cerasi TaxID=741063 RepID=A0ABW1Z8M5_9BACT|nr:SurA N-terminal domain-containing protein [Granulicella cerasi]